MKTILCSFLALGIVITTAIYGEDEHHCLERQNPNHFYFGPEFIGMNLKTHVHDINVNASRF
jgi:hypothetical protein